MAGIIDNLFFGEYIKILSTHDIKTNFLPIDMQGSRYDFIMPHCPILSHKRLKKILVLFLSPYLEHFSLYTFSFWRNPHGISTQISSHFSSDVWIKVSVMSNFSVAKPSMIDSTTINHIVVCCTTGATVPKIYPFNLVIPPHTKSFFKHTNGVILKTLKYKCRSLLMDIYILMMIHYFP